MKNSEYALRWAMATNALFSTTSALLSLGFAHLLADWLGLSDHRILWGLGLGLLLFAVGIASELRRPTLRLEMVRTVIVLDWLWVIGSILLLASRVLPGHAEASALIGGLALAVMALAGWQQHHWYQAWGRRS
ncbi:MAG: hypothetical protein AAF146_18555 [Bacteroidota bacterium]